MNKKVLVICLTLLAILIVELLYIYISDRSNVKEVDIYSLESEINNTQRNDTISATLDIENGISGFRVVLYIK